jgi:energy-coupling factor transport system ATP-binding protein
MRQQVISLLVQLKQQWTLLIVSHEPGELVEFADRCWTLDHGELTSVDPAVLTARLPLAARAE